MTTTELMNLSIEELRDLNTRLVEVLKLKKQTIAFVNKETFTKGMIAEYVGTSTNIHYKKFEIVKINRTKAECKCVVTGKLWNIQIANLKPTNEVAEISEMQIDRTERQPNNRKQW